MKLYLNSRYTFFKIYDSGVYGFILIFNQQGELVQALNSEGAAVIQNFRGGATPAETIDKIEAAPRKSPQEIKTFLEELLSKGILLKKKPALPPAWLDPKDEGTLRTEEAGRFNRRFSRYLSQIFPEDTALIDTHKKFLPYIRKLFPRTPGNRLAIDIGSGDGYYADALQERQDRVVAADISLKRLKILKNRRAGRGELKNLLAVSDAQCLPFKTDRFDFVLCVFVLEHVPHIHRVIEEISRIARRDARVIFAFPSLSIKDTVTLLFGLREPTLNFEHFHLFGILDRRVPWCRSTGSLIKKIKSENLEIKKIRGINLPGSHSENFFKKILVASIDRLMGMVFPFNRLGEQTVIVAKKK